MLRLFHSYYGEEQARHKYNDIPFRIFKNLTCMKRLSEAIEGGYALLLFIEGVGMVAYRDPYGIRPLVYGKDEGCHYCFASESVALEGIGFEFVREVQPGEVIFISVNGLFYSSKLALKSTQRREALEEAPCMFERVYFSSPKSRVQGTLVRKTRQNLGELLGQKVAGNRPLMDHYDAVCAVPETWLDAAFGLSDYLKLPLIKGIHKVERSGRTFILPSKKRGSALKHKFTINEDMVKDKKLLLVDDSLVRGATLKCLISDLKKNGVKEVSLAFSCPPIQFGCFYGIDFPEKKELLAFQKSHEEMAIFLGVKELFFWMREIYSWLLIQKSIALVVSIKNIQRS